MPLQAGLFKTQDQNEQDLTQGPGWTIDDQKPSVFSGFGVTPIARGIGQGVAEGVNVLTHGMRRYLESGEDKGLSGADFAGVPSSDEEDKAPPWKVQHEALEATETASRDFSKSLLPDPRTTGVAANVVQGFSKAATEFTVGSIAGGPAAGAGLLGATDGYAHYQDLRDQGVDEATAAKSAVLTAAVSGGSAFLPMATPARFLANLSKPVALLAQASTGAVLNTGFNAASRYASAKILDAAGYPAQAEQEQPWDTTNLITDAITGLFFGAHAGWHGIKDLKAANVDPSIRDAAKVVQDRQEVIERAPGIPVDMPSAAIHRQALDKAISDLTAGRSVDLADVPVEGATFARRPVEEGSPEALKVMRDHFEKSGALDFAEDFDRWLAGDKEAPKEATASQKAPESAESVKAEPAGEEGGYDVGESEEMTDEQRELFQGLRSEGEPGVRSELHPEQEPDAVGRGESGEPVSGGPSGRAARGSERAAGAVGEPLAVHRGSNEPLSPRDFEPGAFGHATERPSAGLGVFFTSDKAEAAGYGEVTTHHLDIRNPLHIRAEDLPGFDSIQDATKWREQQRAKGHDGLIIDASHMGGQTWYVPFEHSQVRAAAATKTQRAASPALADRPNLQIADETGNPKSAADELARATAEEAQANKEADSMHDAAVKCEARHA